MLIALFVVILAFYYGLFKAGKFVKDNPAKSLQAVSLLHRALRK